jgi:hypothetical protein
METRFQIKHRHLCFLRKQTDSCRKTTPQTSRADSNFLRTKAKRERERINEKNGWRRKRTRKRETYNGQSNSAIGFNNFGHIKDGHKQRWKSQDG